MTPLQQAPVETSPAQAGLLAELGWIDLTALAIIAVFLVLGLFRGFVWQISRIVTLVLAYVAAGWFGESLSTRIAGWFGEGVHPDLPLYIAYFAVFLVVLVVVSLIAFVIDKLVEKTGLTFYNRLGGGVLGIGTGACVVVGLLSGILMFFGQGTNVVHAARSSKSLAISQQAMGLLGSVIPEPVREMFGVDPSEDPGTQEGPDEGAGK